MGECILARTSSAIGGGLSIGAHAAGNYKNVISNQGSYNANTKYGLGQSLSSAIDSGEYIAVVYVGMNSSYGNSFVFVVDDASKEYVITLENGTTLTFTFEWQNAYNCYWMNLVSSAYIVIPAQTYLIEFSKDGIDVV